MTNIARYTAAAVAALSLATLAACGGTAAPHSEPPASQRAPAASHKGVSSGQGGRTFSSAAAAARAAGCQSIQPWPGQGGPGITGMVECLMPADAAAQASTVVGGTDINFLKYSVPADEQEQAAGVQSGAAGSGMASAVVNGNGWQAICTENVPACRAVHAKLGGTLQVFSGD